MAVASGGKVAGYEAQVLFSYLASCKIVKQAESSTFNLKPRRDNRNCLCL